MTKRLSNEKIREVKRLLAAGNSQRQVAKTIGISRITIQRIAHGKREERLEPLKVRTGPIERCPGCGRKIMMPCLACLITSKQTPDTESLTWDFEFEDDETKRRYEKVKEWRDSQDNSDVDTIPNFWPFQQREKKTSGGRHNAQKRN